MGGGKMGRTKAAQDVEGLRKKRSDLQAEVAAAKDEIVELKNQMEQALQKAYPTEYEAGTEIDKSHELVRRFHALPQDQPDYPVLKRVIDASNDVVQADEALKPKIMRLKQLMNAKPMQAVADSAADAESTLTSRLARRMANRPY